jgi:hypothetical protein
LVHLSFSSAQHALLAPGGAMALLP